MKKVYFFEFWSGTPHLETAFELAKRHVDAGDEVHFYFCGHDAPYKEWITFSPEEKIIQLGLAQLPECRAAKLVNAANFHFYPRVNLQPVAWDVPDADWTMASLKAFRYKDYDAGLSVLSSLVTVLKASIFDLQEYQQRINFMLDSGIQVYQFVKNLLVESSPDLVYLFNGRFCHYRAVMDAARSCGIPFLVHERGANLCRYYVQPFMPHDTKQVQKEILATWERNRNSPEAVDTAKKFFIERRQGKEQGWYSFTGHQASGKLPELYKGRKVVSYFSSSDDEYVAVGDIYKWEFWPNQLEAVRSLIGICQDNPSIQLIIRLHPHLAQKSAVDRQLWMSLAQFENVTVIAPESEVDTYALVQASDIVVSAGSTVGIEAVYWGIPSINLGPSVYSELDATYKPENTEQLEALLNADFLQADPDKALPFGYYFSTFGNEFIYYKPETLFAGKFLGVNLQNVPFAARTLLKIKRELFDTRF